MPCNPLVLLAVSLKPDLEKRLTALAERTGRSETFFAQQAFEQHLEDLEDYCLGMSLSHLTPKNRVLIPSQIFSSNRCQGNQQVNSHLMKRSLTYLLVSLCVFSGGLQAADPRKPNLILILADDLGHETLGANGGTSYRTPVLDKLAATGARFTHCYAQPLCTPTRVQLMSGLSNARNYINFGNMNPKAVTFGNLLKAAGYATCIAGKWQLGPDLDLPKKFGFDALLGSRIIRVSPFGLISSSWHY
jgi:hypothetical protein